MSIASALQSGVSGLRSQGMKLATISDNIANSATVGYKRRDVQFATLVTDQGSSQTYSAGGTIGTVRTEISKEGVIIGSSNGTDLAIAGRGFFVTGSDAEPGPGGNSFSLTRAGSFRPDDAGFLRNAAGDYLQGFRLNPDGTFAAGTPSFDSFADMETVNVANVSFTGAPTANVGLTGNLPSQLTGAAPGGPLVTGIEYFDELGSSQRLTIAWQPTATANDWTLTIHNGADTTAPVLASDTVSFTGGGALAGTPAAYGPGLGVAPDGTLALAVSPTQTLSLSLGAPGTYDGMTQFDGDYTPTIDRDGAASGQIADVEITDDGQVVALFDNGARRPVFQVPVADVTNPDGLTPLDGNLYRLGTDAGSMRLYAAGDGPTGSVAAGALENANVDIAEELTSLIQTQRAYSSNATIVRTADEMLEEATRLKR